VKPQDQEFIYVPGVQYGDCMRACVASLLDLPIAEVPHFLRDADGEPDVGSIHANIRKMKAELAQRTAGGDAVAFGRFHTRKYPDGSTFTFETHEGDPDSFSLYAQPVAEAAAPSLYEQLDDCAQPDPVRVAEDAARLAETFAQAITSEQDDAMTPTCVFCGFEQNPDDDGRPEHSDDCAYKLASEYLSSLAAKQAGKESK
jgi:hypothetical protein